MTKDQSPSINAEQLQAIAAVKGNLLIIASAGTGKTTTIVERYANLIQNHGFTPGEILMTTFTNKAAKDMRNKIQKRMGLEPPYVGTMHSLFLKIMRLHVNELGLKSHFIIIDESDKKKMMRQILLNNHITYSIDNSKYFIRWIGKFKNRGILAENLSANPDLDIIKDASKIEEEIDEDIISVDPIMRRKVNLIYKAYEEALRTANSIDLDDILLLTLKLFENNPEIRENYSTKFKAIMVDEAQDLNVVQIKILNLLQRDNLCLIGDDCQNIYEWRGSSNQLVFDFNETQQKVFLKDNYRSAKDIITAVNKVIDAMKFKIDKQLNCTKTTKGTIAIESFPSSREEMNYIVFQLKRLLAKGVPKEEIAILFRTNRIGKDLERELRKNKIPCQLSKSKDFFEREEIKDIISFLKLRVNPDSVIDFQRVLGLMEGFGTSTIKKFQDLAIEKNYSLIESLNHPEELKCNGEKTEEIDRLKRAFNEKDISPIESFMRVFGYSGKITKKYSYELEKLEDKQENISVLLELYLGHGNTQEEISNFLDSLIDLSKKEKSKDKVVLSTIHSAKGLEWEHVFLVSCNERTLPYYHYDLDDFKKDAELRLFYVAISRAKESLTITHYEKSEWGKEQERSQFIDIME